HLGGIVCNDRFLRPEAYVGPVHASQPFQGLLHPDGARASGHPLHHEGHRRGGGDGTVRNNEQTQEHGKGDCPRPHRVPPPLCPVWPVSPLMTDMSKAEVSSGTRSRTTVVPTTRLARISRASVVRLPAIRHASASQRRLSRRYKTKPAAIPTIPAGSSSQR